MLLLLTLRLHMSRRSMLIVTIKKGKNPITRTQWRRYQRYKKATANDNTFDPKGKQKVVKIAKRLVKEKLSLPLIKKNHHENDEMDSDFMDSELDFDKAMFKKPNGSIKSLLQPLFIQARVDDIGVNKVLVDDGDAVNLMPQSLLWKIGKFNIDLKPRNIFQLNYE
ncbi:hypothetical protein MTR_4g046867 [Medicago truncatula]|uniref:Uncharacterized protein n=1 Tax=Medicago truncatula TaxID=3880 RepID=A0A072UIS9_MEDTR|nr:hypothetical protein MTR_4g046867 [Medicago truncatula]